MKPKKDVYWNYLTSFACTISSNKEVSSRAMKAWTVKLKPVAKIYGVTHQFSQVAKPHGNDIGMIQFNI